MYRIYENLKDSAFIVFLTLYWYFRRDVYVFLSPFPRSYWHENWEKSQIQYSVMPYLIDCSVSEMCGDIISWKRESLFIYCSIHDVNVAKRVCTKQNHICIHVINYCACLLQEIPNRPILFLIAAYFDQPYRIGYMFSVNKNHENILLFRFIII